MIELNITPEQLERAKNLYPFTALKSSINNGADNLIGALGEVLVSDYFKAKIKAAQHTLLSHLKMNFLFCRR